MADIRIKDLSSASSSASDDFIAVDGTTNGTRKLNAFSPTFGGNVVVTGTLTSNSTLSTAAGLIAQNADFNAGYIILRGYGSQDGGLVFFGQSANNNFINSNATTISTSIAGSAVSNNVAAGFRVLTTTASTTTSTGALVVGNGTSGGLGVGGSIVAGGNITVSGTVGVGIAAGGDIGLRVQPTLSTGSNQYGLYSYPTVNAATVDGGFFGVAAAASSSVGSAFSLRAYTPTLNAGAAISTIFGLKVENHGAAGVTNAYGIDISAQSGASSTNVGLRNAGTTLLTNSTASTSTSSGALVVSGGVGVAGAIVTGGIIRCGGSNGLSLGSDTGNIRIDSAGPAGVEFRGLSAADTITGFTMREMALIDGTTAPSTRAGYATIYVDTADGDLKVKFGDGTVKTIATDS